MNYNIKISLDKIKGARIEKLPMFNGEQMDFICLPIINRVGTVMNGSVDENREIHPFRHCYLNLEAIEVRDQSRGTHILVAGVSKEIMQTYTEEQLRRRPVVGNIVPWGTRAKRDE